MTLSQTIQTLRTSAKLGWNLDGNWLPPLAYFGFALIAPIAGVLMLVFMYKVVLGVGGDKNFLAFLVSGAAAFMFVRLLLSGAGMVVVEDREHYRIFRYMYIAPSPFPIQVFGRVLPKIGISIAGSLFTVIAGWLFFALPFRAGGIDWMTLAGSLVIASIGMGAMGWMLASLMLLIDRMGWVFAEGIAGLMFLLTGAVIPLDILPVSLAQLGKLVPITYWIDLWRLAIYGNAVRLALPSMAVGSLWMRLAVLSLVWLIGAAVWYFVADRLARHWGRLERETFY